MERNCCAQKNLFVKDTVVADPRRVALPIELADPQSSGTPVNKNLSVAFTNVERLNNSGILIHKYLKVKKNLRGKSLKI